jgi:hypothetical protein
MMLTTVMLAAGLLAAPEPQAEPQKGWVVELHGYTYHPQTKAKRWIIEVRGFTEHWKQAETPKGSIIDFQWPQPKATPKVEPIEAQYHDDLSAFLGQLKVEAVEAFYVDDLPAYINQLKKR